MIPSGTWTRCPGSFGPCTIDHRSHTTAACSDEISSWFVWKWWIPQLKGLVSWENHDKPWYTIGFRNNQMSVKPKLISCTEGAGDGQGLLARLLDDCCWHLGPTMVSIGVILSSKVYLIMSSIVPTQLLFWLISLSQIFSLIRWCPPPWVILVGL